MGSKAYSVLMSIYYKENPAYFKECIESILNQTLNPSEIVIVKDGQLTSELEAVLSSYQPLPMVKVISLEENKGLGEALNIGLKNCTNDLVARMDTDDIAKSDRCEKQVNAFLKNNELALVSSSIAEFSDDVNQINSIRKVPIEHDDIIRYAKSRNPFNHPAVMFKKSAVEKAGGYKHFPFFEDYYLWVRMLMNGAVSANISEPLVYMRANDGLFERRGGFNYLICMLKFRYHLKKIGFINLKQFIVPTFIQFIVTLLPNKARAYIYKKLLRSK